MKKIYQLPIIVLFISLCALHIYLFVSGISLSDDVNKSETSIKKLKQENMDLEKKLYNVESLSNAASQAALLNYSEKAVPVYLNNLGIALNR